MYAKKDGDQLAVTSAALGGEKITVEETMVRAAPASLSLVPFLSETEDGLLERGQGAAAH